MEKIKEQIKKSFFIVNKVYLFIVFLFISVQDIGLGLIYFLGTLFVFIWKTLRSKVPMEVSENIEVKTFVYKIIDEKQLKIDIYYPLDRSKGKYPLVYFCHGGGWISGFRNQPNNISWCRYLASRGFIASSIDYRYGYKNTIKDILADYSDGLEFIKTKSDKLKIDTDNIVLMGLSAGGHLALLYSSFNTFMEDKERMKGIKSVVAYYPPSDLKDLFKKDSKSLFTRFAASRTLKGTPVTEEEVYANYSPNNWLSEKMIPTLVVHGKLDRIVPFDSSIKLIKRLKALNVPSSFLVHSKGFHSFDTELKDYTTISIIKKTIRFIKASIKGDIKNENY
ncbi:alpha/beta hydrolase family protein [Tissierella creatinophila]|uniref:Acetyl esterase n=1 Tax=Tissierella creatinophila DSM 6911 TaxID=1123403 RepID=A0A1U7M5F1_TISCR|nr:alpha/beta hydrolase [Tissierella creatinophila]OLS02537.1 acetyl esterase [Tissierella creatinophila DSM 6911]